MAKQLLLNVLVRVLGEFIELDENNFSLGVWSGTVVLTNLKLKADNILQKFNFVIYHGYVERLEIVIPWASLLTNPLKIRIEGVILDVGPVDLDGLNKEDILKMMIQEKLQKLKLIDQFLDISSGIVLSSELQAQKSSASTTSESQQFKQLFTIYSNIAALQEVRDPKNLRPPQRPLDGRKAVRAWWKYGVRLINMRNKYLKMLKLIKKAQAEKLPPDAFLPSKIYREFQEMEERLPLKVLEAFRKRAAAEFVEEQKVEKSKSGKRDGGQWWGLLGGQTSGINDIVKTGGEDISMEGILSELDRLESSNARQAFQAFSLSLSTSCTATICSNQRTLVKIQASMAMGFEKKYDTMHARCDLQNLLITDELGICPFHEKIVSMKALDLAHAHAKDADTVGTTIIADVVRGKANVQIFSLPLEIYLNKLIIHALLTEFAVPKQNKARRIKRKMHAMKLDSHLGDGSTVMKGQADISVTIKVHGPKIIIPEDSARDLGCLLLDCGYIELVSVLNSSGMTCDLKINAVNAGLPLTINDVYCLKGSSLYLIKPFDVALMAQNIDQSEADMTVSMSLSPGVNGELDRNKLARLLRITNGMTDVLSPKAALFGDEANHAGFGGDSKMISGVSRHTSGVELAGMTPAGLDALSPTVSRKDGEDSNGSTKAGASLSMAATIAPFPVIPSPFADTKDPETVEMKIKVSIVSVSLDLMYDNAEYKEHIVFMIKGLELEMLNRPFDRQINFVLSDLSVQDSWRCDSQRYVAWTPQSGDTNLITVSYLSVSTPESPLYTTHGSELRAEFSELCLAVDTATLLHLKPFMEVLLDKSNRTTVVQTLMTDTDQEDSSANRYRLISMLPTVIDGPIGMKVDASLKLININLLRAPSVDVKHERGAPLEEAFSMDMMNMRVNVDMKELMNSTLRLGRVHILDNRKLSKDYVFRHLFCPSAMHPASEASTTATTSATTGDATDDDGAEGDLVTLFYNQESKQQTFITVAIAGISSYIAIDAMLDFSLIAMANFFAFTNPAIRETRAIVAQCAVEVHFTREVKTFEATGRVEMSESVHCSIAENEMYVLRSIHTWHPIPILERFGVEVHVRRTVVNDVPQLMSAHVEVDDIDAKLSFNDLLLGLSILNRKSLAHRGISGEEPLASTGPSSSLKANSTASASTSQRTAAGSSTSPTSPPVKPATILVQFGLTSLHATLVNDFTTLPIPVLRLSAEDISFVADGTLQQLRGEGSTHMKVEYFNSPTLVWEPVVDSWKPGLLVNINEAVQQITLQAEHTLQLTVSGSMLETLLKSYSVFFHENHEASSSSSSSVSSSSSLVPIAAAAAASSASASSSSASVSSEIVVQNVLGEGVEVHLQDSVSRAIVLHLADGATGVVSATADPMKKSWMKMFRLPNAVDLHVVGHGLEGRRPVLHLPFTVTKPKACMLLPSNGKSSAVPATRPDGATSDRPVDDNAGDNNNNKVFIVEAIEEEVYENARYDPIAGQWRSPFLLGDPYSFTDASGLVRKDMQSLQIQSDKWEWSGDWEVDMDGIPGRDFDDEGWEYASSFSFFTMVSARRTFQSMDGVRRRRWTRTRVPKIMNYLSCALYVELHHSSWPRSHRIGPILEGETFCVPLMQSYASELRFKTSFTHSQWSPWYPCNIHSYDFKASKDVVCHHGVRSSYFRMWTVRDDKMLTVKLFPYVRILNRLLCDVQYNCMDRALASVEQGDIASGQETQLIHANFKDEVRLSILAMIDRSALQLAVRTDYASASAKNNHHHALVRGFVNDAERALASRWDAEALQSWDDNESPRRPPPATAAAAAVSVSSRPSPRETLPLLSRSNSNSAASRPTTPSPLSSKSTTVRFPLIENVANVSPQNPLLVKMDLGTAAYTDSTYRWTHLPSVFRNKYSIRFANADRIYRSSQFFSFTTTTDTLLFVLVDASCVPKWITSSGFQPTTELAISRRIHQNRAWETNYRVYGQEVVGGTDVVLGGAWGNAEPNMYAVVLITTAEWKAEEAEEENSSTKGSIEIHSERSSIIYHVSYALENLPGLYHRTELITFMPRFVVLNCLEESVFIAQRGSHRHLEFVPYTPEGWHQFDDKLGFDVKFRCHSTIWSLGSVNINEIGSTVLYIPYAAIEHGSGGTSMMHSRGMVLHVEVKLANHTDRCSIIVVLWQETIEAQATMSVQNDTDLPITIRQADLELDHDLGSKEALYELVVPPHKHLPYGLCDPDCGQNVLVTVGTSLQHASKRVATLNILKVGHRLRLPYTLMQPGDNPTNATRGEVILNVTTSDVGHVLRITSPLSLGGSGGGGRLGSANTSSVSITDLLEEDESMLGDDTAAAAGTGTGTGTAAAEVAAASRALALPLFCFNIQLSSFGISLVLEKPRRREFLSLYVDGIQLKWQRRGHVNTLEFAVMDLQVDNYSESAIYPIILRSTKKEIHKSVVMDGEEEFYADTPAMDDLQRTATTASTAKSKKGGADEQAAAEKEKPLLQLLLVRDVNVESQQAIFQRVVLRILPLAMEVDSATMQILFLDLLDDLKVLTSDQALALTMPPKWHRDFNRSLFYPGQQVIDMIAVKTAAQRHKMYIKKLTIHPMKMTISLYQTALPRRSKQETLQSALLNFLLQLAGVEKLQIRLSSFDVEDAMESTETLLSLILTKSGQDLRSQLASIAGSLAVLGSPIGFARKVGSGVKAFFYEPYLGVVEGSNDFLSGLKKGTTRLISGVVTGTMDSAVAMMGSASKSISYLTGDEDYPLVGLTDGISSIAYGISTEVDPNNIFIHVRPPRALEPSPLDPSNWILVPLNLDAAFAQEFVMKRAIQHKYDDRFLTYVPLAHKDEAVILSEVYIFWRRKKNLWGRVWANISHCVPLGTGLGIMLYSGALQGKAELVVIPCGSTVTLRRLYTAVAQNVHRMGNPAKVTPAALVDWSAQGQLIPNVVQHPSSSATSASFSFSSSASSSSATAATTMGLSRSSGAVDLDAHQQHQQLLQQQQQQLMLESEHYRRLLRDASLLSELDGHRFGSVNSKALSPPLNGMTEADVLTRVQQSIQRGSRSWKEVDELIWRMLWDWGCVHANIASCRIAATLLINRSDSPLQVTRVQMMMGRNVIIMGSKQTGYEAESRILWPRGYVVVVLVAFPQSPLEIGHLKAVIHSAAFTLMVASTQRESSCEAKGGFTTGFLEKTVSEWWSKYVVLVS
eukprot:gene6747-4866_t